MVQSGTSETFPGRTPPILFAVRKSGVLQILTAIKLQAVHFQGRPGVGVDD